MNKRFRIQLNLSQHIKENYWLYILTLCSLSIGVLSGIYAVKYMSSLKKTDLAAYLKSFTQTLYVNNINYHSIFIEAIKNNIPLIFFIAILGLTFIGIPLILFIDFIKGFTLGFTVSFIISNMGYKGIWVILAGVMPQNIIYIPCFIVASVLSLELGSSILKRKLNKKSFYGKRYNVTTYFLSFIFIITIMFIGFAIESYITPNIVKLIVFNSGVFV